MGGGLLSRAVPVCCGILLACCFTAVAEVQHHTVLLPKQSPLAGQPKLETSAAPLPVASTNQDSEATDPPTRLSPGVETYPFSSANLRPVTPGPDEAAKLEMYRTQLELGRSQRQAADWQAAEDSLTRLMAMAAPLEFHRSALLELGLLAQDRRQFARAQQIFSQYVQRFQEDPTVPEVLLRQGLLYRDMGAPTLALSKFYAVMSSALSLKLDRLAYYQRMVLQAQSEIADTFYLEGKHDDAADYFKRLLKLNTPDLNREEVHYKLVRCCAGARRFAETLTQAQLFAELHPESGHLAEVRFLQSDALKQLGRKDEAIRVVLALMERQRATAKDEGANWAYWQQRTGNELANQLYLEGDFVNALQIYRRLGELDSSPTWRVPAWYQAGLIYERLNQPQKASEVYGRIIEDGKNLAPEARTSSLGTVLEMARWRQERLTWQTKAEQVNEQIAKGTSLSQ